MNRREFLGAGLGAGIGALLPWRGPAPNAERRVVLIELRGGNDGLNTIVPFEDDAYHRLRPLLAVPKREVLPLDDLSGFHPSLRATARRFAEGQLALVREVGYAGPNLSHFRSQDFWGAAAVADPLPPTGWLGEWSDRTGAGGSGPALVGVGADVVPRPLRARASMACAVRDLASFRIPSAPDRDGPSAARSGSAALAAMQRVSGDALLARFERAFDAATEAARALSAAARVRPRGAYPGGVLGRDLATVAQMIGGRVPARAYHVALDGFDTHASQRGTHDRLLAELDGALDAFLDDLKLQGTLADTLVLTVSEFGRRPRENGMGATAGTDHGAASVLLCAGGGARAGGIGSAPDLTDLDEDGNPPARIDFRQVYASVLEDWLGESPETARSILGGAYEKIPLVAT